MTVVSLSDREKAIIEQISVERGISFDETVNQLFSEGLAMRVKRKTGRNPASNVRNFKRGKH